MTDLLEAEDALQSTLGRLSKRSRYVELVAQRTEGLRLRLDNTTTIVETVPVLLGAVFRVWTGSAWVEGASSRLELPMLRQTAELLERRLDQSPTGPDPPGPLPKGKIDRAPKVKKTPANRVASMREHGQELHDWGMGVKGIDNVWVSMGTSSDERLFLATSGGWRHQSISRSVVAVSPIARENGRADYDFVVRGGGGGLEILDQISQAEVEATARNSLALLRAKAPPAGRTTVVLDPSTSGTFAHESFGHGTEADQLLRKRSYLGPLLGQKLGPECVTLVDDGSYPGGIGSSFFDDEGTPTHRTVMVEKGRFVEVLHDRESAAELHRAPTGNARRADFLSRTFVRMTNTFVEPQDWGLEEMIAEAKNGVLLESCTSGIEDPLGGNMQIKVKRGRLIEHGKLTDMVSSMALSGKVLDFLAGIRGVGKRDQFEFSPGFCGKGQTDMLPVSSGGPYLLSEAVVGPA